MVLARIGLLVGISGSGAAIPTAAHLYLTDILALSLPTSLAFETLQPFLDIFPGFEYRQNYMSESVRAINISMRQKTSLSSLCLSAAISAAKSAFLTVQADYPTE